MRDEFFFIKIKIKINKFLLIVYTNKNKNKIFFLLHCSKFVLYEEPSVQQFRYIAKFRYVAKLLLCYNCEIFAILEKFSLF